MDDREIRVPFLVGANNFSLLHRVQIGSAVQPAFSTIGTGDCVPGGMKRTHLHLVPRLRTAELYLHPIRLHDVMLI
jgi:hypothetical protein